MFSSRTRLKFFIASLLLPAFVLFGAPRALAASFGASVEASCGVQLDFGPTDNNPYSASFPGAIPALNCASAGFAADFYGEGEGAATSGLASASGSVGFGAVGVNLATRASSTPLIDGAIASASFNASWFDTLTITGPSQGEPIQFELTASIAGSMTCGGETSGSVFYSISWGQATTIDFSDDNCSNKLAGTQHAVIDVSVGQQLTIGGLIISGVRAVAGNGCCGSYTLTSEQDLTAGNTFSLFITPLTPGASFISASGTDYAAVPEPSTWAMLVLGFTGLGVTGWRRRRRAGSSPRWREHCRGSTAEQAL
jgi:PEP-CTERM motif